MKIPTDLDPKPPPLEEFWPRTPHPLKEFLDPPLGSYSQGYISGVAGGGGGCTAPGGKP